MTRQDTTGLDMIRQDKALRRTNAHETIEMRWDGARHDGTG